MVQRAMSGPELSIDCLGDRDGRCLNAIPRTMLESRGGESIKGQVVARRGAGRAGPQRDGGAAGGAARRRSRCSATRTSALGITDVNTRFGGAFPAPAYAALPGRTYPRADRARWPPASRWSRTWASSARDDVHALLLAAGARRASCNRPAATSSRARIQLHGHAARRLSRRSPPEGQDRAAAQRTGQAALRAEAPAGRAAPRRTRRRRSERARAAGRAMAAGAGLVPAVRRRSLRAASARRAGARPAAMLAPWRCSRWARRRPRTRR